MGSNVEEEVDIDFDYKAFLKNLRCHEKSYVLKVMVDGLPSDVKYEGLEISDEERDGLNKRVLRSASKRTNVVSNGSLSTYLSEEAENLSQRNSRKRAKRGTLVPNEIVEDPDYAAFLRGCKIVGDQPVYADGHYTNCGESDGQDDDWAPHVEFLDRATFYKEGNCSSSMEKNNSEFRCQLIDVLRKPYDKEEYKKLWANIKLRKMAERHKELRHGREKSCPTNKSGKSFLDHHTDLWKQLSRLNGDGPKSLNLLRGFYFWLEKAPHDGSFLPWKDKKCLAIIPESG